jgi:hypothetical protein
MSQREVGADTKSFAGALRSALRQDPDVILVGEMRDAETMRLALTAAEWTAATVEAGVLNAAIAGFDAQKAWVEEQAHYKGAARPKDEPAPYADTVDWSAPDAPCRQPDAK